MSSATMDTDTLAAQQLALCRAITAPGEPAVDRLLRTPPGREPLLRIYRHAVPARLCAALRDNFGLLPRVMGDAAFDALALAYQHAQPSRTPSIRWFGDGLADFMAQREDLVGHPALVDLARMEWALRGAFDAADAEPLGATALQAVPADDWPRLVFMLLPSVRRVPMQWAVEPLWRALNEAPADAEPQLPEPEPLPHLLLAWRQGFETRWRSVDAGEAALLQAAAEGRDFAQLCELGGVAAVAALQRWVADGLLAGIGQNAGPPERPACRAAPTPNSTAVTASAGCALPCSAPTTASSPPRA